ncbi:MAG TPA: GNAT family N-acetyltransferase [Polyangia bacterium]|nr:GNAT family N-acetyltransferase [Polyangia bacterium]
MRRARPEDWPGAEALWREIDALHAELAPAYFRAGARPELDWQRLLDDPTAMVLVGDEGDGRGPLGLLSLRVYDTPAEPTMVSHRRAHLETLVVARRARRRGIGRRLVAAAADWARAQGAVEIVLTAWTGNADADAFYERLGYRVLSRVLHAPL